MPSSRTPTLRLAGYPPNEFAGPEEERKGPTEHRRLYLGRTVLLILPAPSTHRRLRR